jgi:hypothetical protein
MLRETQDRGYSMLHARPDGTIDVENAGSTASSNETTPHLRAHRRSITALATPALPKTVYRWVAAVLNETPSRAAIAFVE